jgi:hypothetical protein
MNGKYDKILKENLEEIFLPLAKKLYLGRNCRNNEAKG